jgi:hypothetical protein
MKIEEYYGLNDQYLDYLKNDVNSDQLEVEFENDRVIPLNNMSVYIHGSSGMVFSPRISSLRYPCDKCSLNLGTCSINVKFYNGDNFMGGMNTLLCRLMPAMLPLSSEALKSYYDKDFSVHYIYRPGKAGVYSKIAILNSIKSRYPIDKSILIKLGLHR